MSKVVIIGGGIAGLSAGIFAAKAGYETEIYEKNLIPGGNCSGWKRGPYTIDNCIHWMTGTLKDTPQYNLWKEVGALGDDIPLHKRESFCSSELDGKTITLWRDVERTRKEMLDLSPEDEKEINRFINTTKAGMKLQISQIKDASQTEELSKDLQSRFHTEIIKTLIEYVGINLEELGARFKHPLLQKVMSDFMNKDYEAYWLVFAYSIFACGNGELPEGGSMGVVNNMVKTFKNCGGKLFLGKPVKQIQISKKRFPEKKKLFDEKSINFHKVAKVITRKAEGIILADGTFVSADYLICACDVNYLFSALLKKRYKPAQLIYTHKHYENYPLYSSFQVAFSVEGEMPEVDQLTFSCQPVSVARSLVDRICVKNYRVYGDFIAPKGSTVIQCSIVQRSEDFDFWAKLHSDTDLYQITKKNIADEIQNRIETRFPEYKDKIKLIDVWTPYTYSHRNNSYKGAYMRFITTATNPTAFIPCEIPLLKNVVMASHWLRYPGGIPTAVTVGKVAAHKVISMDTKGINLEKIEESIESKISSGLENLHHIPHPKLANVEIDSLDNSIHTENETIKK